MHDEDLPHGARCDGHELPAILLAARVVEHDPQPGFMDEQRRLQAVRGPLPCEKARRHVPQVGVDDLGEPRRRLLVTVRHQPEQARHLAERRRSGH
jgi:hypothetical protein